MLQAGRVKEGLREASKEEIEFGTALLQAIAADMSEAERDALMRVPGEDAWMDELFTSGGHKDKLRTVLRAYRANLRTNEFSHKACRKAEAALLDRINTTQLEEAKDWLVILEAVCNPRQNKVARNRCLKEARQRVEDLAVAINRSSAQPG